MEKILDFLIEHTRSRILRTGLWLMVIALATLTTVELAVFVLELRDPRSEAALMIWPLLSHLPTWGLTVPLLVLAVVALSAAQIFAAFVRVGFILKPTPTEPDLALLRGEVKRFEVLDARNLTQIEFEELEEDFRRGEGMFYYIALVQITTGKSPSRTSNWRFAVRSKVGERIVPFVSVTKHWGAPASWPRIDYCTLDEVENSYLTENRVYNVFLHLESTAGLASTLDLDSFEARFTDGNNHEIVCRMQSAEAERMVASGPRVEIARFESLEHFDRQYYASRIKILDVVKNGATYAALLTLEAGDDASAIARDWSFSGRMKDGQKFPIKVVDYGLGPPPQWGNDLQPFGSVDGVRIAKGSLHRTYVHLGVKPQDLDPNWLEASFDDDTGHKRIITFNRGRL